VALPTYGDGRINCLTLRLRVIRWPRPLQRYLEDDLRFRCGDDHTSPYAHLIRDRRVDQGRTVSHMTQRDDPRICCELDGCPRPSKGCAVRFATSSDRLARTILTLTASSPSTTMAWPSTEGDSIRCVVSNLGPEPVVTS